MTQLAKQPEPGSHMAIVSQYSYETLENIVRDLSRSGAWPHRLQAARIELTRRKKELQS